MMGLSGGTVLLEKKIRHGFVNGMGEVLLDMYLIYEPPHGKTNNLHMQKQFDFFNFQNIRKTCPCNQYPLKPHFYIVKLGYAGVYLFFLFLLQNIDCGYSLEPPRRGGSNVYPQSMF